MKDRKLYTYVLRFDDGAAPNPFWEICTLAICKPRIRSTAQIGDWVIGTGSANSEISKKNYIDLRSSAVYAMKVTDKMTLEEYNEYCTDLYPEKIPNRSSTAKWPEQVGDCIYYDFSNPLQAKIRKSQHHEGNMITDLGGKNVLLSKHFYYFGLAAKELPVQLRSIIKKGRSHKITRDENKIKEFEEWISQFELNKLYGDSQLKWQQSDNNADCDAGCSHPSPPKGTC